MNDTYRRELATLERKASVLQVWANNPKKEDAPKEAYEDNWETDRLVEEREEYGYTN